MVLKELTQLCFNLWLQIRVGISSTHDYINKSLHKKNQRSPHLARLKPWHRLLYHQTLHHQSRNRRRPLLTQELRRSVNRLLPLLSLTRAASSLPYRGRWRMERHRHDEPGITRAPRGVPTCSRRQNLRSLASSMLILQILRNLQLSRPLQRAIMTIYWVTRHLWWTHLHDAE